MISMAIPGIPGCVALPVVTSSSQPFSWAVIARSGGWFCTAKRLPGVKLVPLSKRNAFWNGETIRRVLANSNAVGLSLED